MTTELRNKIEKIIVMTFPEKSTADKMFNNIKNSRLYNSQEIISLSNVTEVCDECNKKRSD